MLEQTPAPYPVLNRLSGKVRQTFLLAQLDGLSCAEIGRRLGVSERLVEKYLAQAMLHCLLVRSHPQDGH